MLTREEIEMTMEQWAVKRGLCNIQLDEKGRAADYEEWVKLKAAGIDERYSQEMSEYRSHEKHEQINSAINALKLKGFEPILKCFENAHIQVKSKKQGKVFNYYATTGTITGYWGTPTKGIDCLIDLLEMY